MRRCQDCVRDSGIKSSLFQDIVTSAMEPNKWNVLAIDLSNLRNVLVLIGDTKERDLDKVLYLVLFACREEGREQICPVG